MPPPGLSRQIVVSMSVLMFSGTMIILISLWGFWGLAFDIDPSLLSPPDSWLPTNGEWLWMVSVTIVGLVLATFFAARLAARILAPLNSVMDSIRRVARGDLAARAVAGDRSLGETAMLVDDFNTMAERLQHVAHEMVTWNAAIAHELRTPVTILRGNLQGLADGVFQPNEARFRGLLTQVEGLGRLIEDLRTLSLADSGHMRLQIEPIDLADEIREVTRLIEPDLTSSGFSLLLDLIETPVRCDAARIRQVVVALLDNAKRYATPGILRLTTSNVAGWVHLRLEDVGPGIDDELASHVFEAFRRGEDSRAREHGGSGLGLAVVRAIAQAHGGVANCSRASTGGTAFEIKWPID